MTVDDGEARLVLEGALEIAAAGELHERMVACLRASAPIVVRAADVEHADTSILQLLLALWRAAAERGVQIHWESPSAALCAAASLFGVSDQLSLVENATAADS